MAQDRYKYFRVEAREILDQLGQGALDIEKGTPGPDSVSRLLRLAHTLKGAARVVKQREIADHAHALEDALALVLNAPVPLLRDTVDRVLSIIDEIGRHVAALSPPSSGAELPHSDSAEPALVAFRPAKDDLDAVFSGVFEAHARLGALRPRLAQVERARHMASLVADQIARPREADESRTASVPNEKLRSMAEDLRGMCAAFERDLTSNIDQLDRELRQVREAAERLRLAPVSALFTFLERAVREVAGVLGKRVVFEASGGEVRVDTFVLNVVQGALLHIVRNAVVHGIEPDTAERTAAGKPLDGRVTLRVSQRGRLVSFACSDDGRGIDLDAVRRIAEQKGLGLDTSRTATREELLRMLLKGGISTSGTVTHVSGRGIGLDVVREAAERLGGEASARTEKHKGTTIELLVPLSVSSFHALVVQASGDTLAIPLEAVRGTLRIAREEVIRTEQRECVLFDGRATPLESLPHSAPAARGPARRAARSSAVVVHGRTGMVAFTVDRIIGTEPIVMRALPEFAPASKVVAGVALDPVGDPILVFDPDLLVAEAQERSVSRSESVPPRATVLVVDDSLTTRMLEQSILESAGYDVDLATSGEEALSKARGARHALFLVDVEMPGMDGFAFIENIRADPSLQHVPCILVTSRNSPEDRQRGRDVGAQDYVVKSEFDQGLLLERIRGLVG